MQVTLCYVLLVFAQNHMQCPRANKKEAHVYSLSQVKVQNQSSCGSPALFPRFLVDYVSVSDWCITLFSSVLVGFALLHSSEECCLLVSAVAVAYLHGPNLPLLFRVKELETDVDNKDDKLIELQKR